MLYAYLAISCIAFIELFIALRIQQDAAVLIARSRDAMSVITSRDLDDDQKEAYTRKASVEMFKLTGLFVVKFLAIAVALFVIYWVTVSTFPDLRAPILASFVSPLFLLGLTVLAIIYVWVRSVLLRQL